MNVSLPSILYQTKDIRTEHKIEMNYSDSKLNFVPKTSKLLGDLIVVLLKRTLYSKLSKLLLLEDFHMDSIHHLKKIKVLLSNFLFGVRQYFSSSVL